jgi:5-methylcytosine-specific restriction endonuclease McrA
MTRPPHGMSTRGVAVMMTASRCWYCGVLLAKEESTLDHVIPRSAGGRTRLGNLVLACKSCNMRKGSLSLEQYRERHNNGELFWYERQARKGRAA